jgi:Sec-independent protein translocase protein TatA
MGDVFFLLVVALIVVVVWRGPKTLPQLAAMFGRGVREAKKEAGRIKDGDSDPGSPAGQ